jgi:molecular chaperone DnaK
VDITPYTFGTSALSYLDGELYQHCYVPIIKKNTPIPVCKSEAFATIVDNQAVAEVRIFQGEKPNALENIELGKFSVEGLGKAPAGNPIIVDLKLDRDGILCVTAKEKKNGLERQITIDNAVPRYNSDELDSARQRIGSLFTHEAHNGSAPAAALKVGADASTAALDTLITQAQAKLSAVGDEDRTELLDLIATIMDNRENPDSTVIEQAKKLLSDLLFYLEA